MRLLLLALTISVIVVLFLFLKVSEPTAKTIKSKPYVPPTSAPVEYVTGDNVFQVVNEWRIKEGYQPFKESEDTCRIATLRAPQLKSDYSHKGFLELLKKQPSGVPYGKYFSENIASNQVFPERYLGSWLSSPLHRKALETNYKYSCIKCDSGYCVQIFSYF